MSNYEWEKDNYHIRDGYKDLVKEILNEVNTTFDETENEE